MTTNINIITNIKDSLQKLNPFYVTGITDAEGNFHITFLKTRINMEFKVRQKAYRVEILYKLQEFFNCGTICIDNQRDNVLKFRVTKKEDILNKIIPHFEKYPLQTSKALDFESFKSVGEMYIKRIHTTKENLEKIQKIMANINKGRSWEDRFNFGLDLYNKGVSLSYFKFSQWFVGFVDGDGSFHCSIRQLTIREKFSSTIACSISQKSHSIFFLKWIQLYIKGRLSPRSDIIDHYNIEEVKARKKGNARKLSWRRKANLKEIFNIFEKYPLHTQKKLDYIDFKNLYYFDKENPENNKEKFIKIKEIKKNINTNRHPKT